MESVESVLKDIVNEFNSRFVDWQITNNCGANLGFSYGTDGRKRITVTDFSLIPEDVPSDKEDERVRSAGVKLEQAYRESPNGSHIQRHEGSDASKNEGSF